MLLNTVLTTERGKTLTHEKWGWQEFTGETLRYLADLEQPIVFMAWGKNAQESVKKYCSNGTNNLILTSCHPAAQLYGKQKFVGNKHFILANEYLIAHKLKPIQWNKN